MARQVTAKSGPDRRLEQDAQGPDAVNSIEVIELRSDPKYGKFIQHEPARARVEVERQDGEIVVEIEDFIYPTVRAA